MLVDATRSLGTTGVEVTPLGFGATSLGGLYHAVSDEEARATVRRALELGIRYIDTSPWYGRGLSEHRVGHAVQEETDANVVISTKVGRVLRPAAHPEAFDSRPWIGGLSFDVRFDYGYDGIMRSYEDSLMRLGLPRVDLLIVHDLDHWYHDDAAYTNHLRDLQSGGQKAFDELRASGQVRGIGVGINDVGLLKDIVDRVDIDFALVAMPYTLLDQAALADDLPICQDRGLGVIIGSVFASGILATGARRDARYGYVPAPEEILERTERIEAVCRRHDVPLAAAALQFPLGHPSVASVIPGASNPWAVERNVEAFGRNIPADLWVELVSEGLIREDAPVPA